MLQHQIFLRELFCLEHGIWPDGKMQVDGNWILVFIFCYVLFCFVMFCYALLNVNVVTIFVFCCRRMSQWIPLTIPSTRSLRRRAQGSTLQEQSLSISNQRWTFRLSFHILTLSRWSTRSGRAPTAASSTLGTWSAGRRMLRTTTPGVYSIVKRL